mgnify:FL=1
MFSAEDKALIRTLYADKHVSIRCIAQMVYVSRNAVRRQIREEGKARAARSAAGAFLKEHAIDVQELHLACEMRCPPLRRRLNKDYQQDIPLRMLQRFCSPMRAQAFRRMDDQGELHVLTHNHKLIFVLCLHAILSVCIGLSDGRA